MSGASIEWTDMRVAQYLRPDCFFPRLLAVLNHRGMLCLGREDAGWFIKRQTRQTGADWLINIRTHSLGQSISDER